MNPPWLPPSISPEPPRTGVEPVDRGIEPVGEKRQRRAASELRQAGRADGHALGQVDMLPGGTGGGQRHVEDGVAAIRPGRRQVGQVPGAIGMPPGQRVRRRFDLAEIADRTGLRVDHVQLVGEHAGIDLRGDPADHRQRAAIRSLCHLDHVPVAEPVHDAQLPGGEIEQPQPRAGELFSPDERVVELGAPALLLLGRLVRGDHGRQPGARERAGIKDHAVPAGQGLGLPAVEPDTVQLDGAGPVRPEEQ
jgi:hypothetical protein